MELAIEIKQLNFSYGKQTILENVNAGFGTRRFSVLLGTNGSGKSTLFKSITGILSGYKGVVEVKGCPIDQLTYKQKARQIGFLPQFYQTVFPFTVEDMLLTGRAAFSGFAPTEKDRVMVAEVLAELGLEGLRKKRFPQLSGGEQQMVMIGRLLMQHPEIIILDEPTNHLDVYYQHFLMNKLKAFVADGRTVIAIMHNPTLAYQFADDFFFMLNKTVVPAANAAVPELDMLKAVYNTNFLHIPHDDLPIVLPVGDRYC
ncbi:ABC transporter ATP-binding protein [Chitinophaga nivalis]|uniref:ABC transporter ATP-binding protein n=1 Tax=Chitinophaga nivalis TaxID=2991709 RepID=A0ABT3IN30_9BACT|nr:ABC transporter ATP-binding protein [Chitinophaga nivalis]MCW3464938.1 ABC transporter ATP-binding protein [Chitinophaga nivalis]MCW3485370.1 ABC transporter ATP-binding protein [Chitinophaga nivalis]